MCALMFYCGYRLRVIHAVCRDLGIAPRRLGMLGNFAAAPRRYVIFWGAMSAAALLGNMVMVSALTFFAPGIGYWLPLPGAIGLAIEVYALWRCLHGPHQ